MLDVARPDLTLGIVGTGLMGRGIAQIAAQAGVKVLLHDARPEAPEAARTFVWQTLSRLAAKGKLAPSEVEATMSRILIAATPEALEPCHVVIEVIVEELDAKQELLRRLEEIVGDDCVLATNTSSLLVTAIASRCRIPERVAGFHFFSPVPLMKVVEVIDGARTADWVCDALTGLATRMGHASVRAK